MLGWSGGSPRGALARPGGSQLATAAVHSRETKGAGEVRVRRPGKSLARSQAREAVVSATASRGEADWGFGPGKPAAAATRWFAGALRRSGDSDRLVFLRGSRSAPRRRGTGGGERSECRVSGRNPGGARGPEAGFGESRSTRRGERGTRSEAACFDGKVTRSAEVATPSRFAGLEGPAREWRPQEGSRRLVNVLAARPGR